MKKYSLHIIAFLLGLLAVGCLMGSCQRSVPTDERKLILVVTDYNPREQPEVRMMTDFRAHFDSTRYRLKFVRGANTERFRLERSGYFFDLRDQMRDSLGLLTIDPDLVILLGDVMAQNGARLDHPWMKEKPVLCLDVNYPDWEGELAKHKNFVVMESHPEPKKNVDFIRDLGRSPWIVLSLDSTFLDEHVRLTIREQMTDTSLYRTNLNYEYCSSLKTTGQNDVPTTFIPINLQQTGGVAETNHLHINADFRIPGILKVRALMFTFLRLKDDFFVDRSQMHDLGNYFTGNPKYFNMPLLSSLATCAGGYLVTWPDMLRQTQPVIDRLLAGEDPQQVGWHKLEKDYWLDWRAAHNRFKYAEDAPDYVKFVNLPWHEKNRTNALIYEWWEPVTLILVIIAAIVVPLLMTRKSRRLHKELVASGREAQAAQEKIEEVLAAAHAYAWEKMPDNSIRFSKEFARLCGSNNPEYGFEELINNVSESREELRQALLDTQEGQSVIEFQSMLPGTQEKHHFISHITRFRDANGRLHTMGFLMLNDDAHDAERIRLEAYALAEENSVKESFLAAMSHEIRSPLNAIVGFADLLLNHNKEFSESERQTFAQHIDDSKDHLLQLLDDVMTYSDKKKENLTLELSHKPVRKLMDETYFMHTVIVPKHLEFCYQAGPDATVMANRSAVLQIMSNLMNNAIKFTPSGSITLGWELSADGQSVILFVQDTGIGVAEADKEKIFDKFSKVDTHSTGAGIGLPLCRQLADSMHADLWVESQLGQGSKFCLKLKKM